MADENLPISEARANLTEVAAQVRLLHRRVMLTQRGKPAVVICPAELDAAIDAAGGLDAALALLNSHAGGAPAPAPATRS